MGEKPFSQEDHDVLIDLKRILLSYIENNTKNAEARDRKLDALQASFTHFQETLHADMCEDRNKVTALEKDVIRLQAGLAAQGTDVVVQKGILQTQIDYLKDRNYSLDGRITGLEEKVRVDIPKEIDDTSDEAACTAKEARAEERRERRDEIIKWCTIIGVVLVVFGYLIGFYSH